MSEPADIIGRIETFIRRLFERSGGAIDFALRRSGQPRTDLSALTPQLERSIEAALKAAGPKPTAPNLIELRYDYETYTGMGEARREYLQGELGANVREFIHNRRYATEGPVQVRIGYDAFTRGLEIHTGFGQPSEPVIAAAGKGEAEAAGGASMRCRVTLRGMGIPIEIHAAISSNAEPAGIGRNVANQMVIKDPTVSNFHAALLVRPDGSVELADRGSANGTCVNGVMLAPGDRVIVRDGDLLKFGEIETLLAIEQPDSGS